MTRSRTNSGRGRNGLIALLGALLTLAVAVPAAGAATSTFTNPFAEAYTYGFAEAYRDARDKGYHLRVNPKPTAPSGFYDDVNRKEGGSAYVHTRYVKAGKSALKISATVRVLSLVDTTSSQGVTLGVLAQNAPSKWGGSRGCGQEIRVTTPGTYTLECAATGISPGTLIRGGVSLSDSFYVYGDGAGSDATAIIDSVTITT